MSVVDSQSLTDTLVLLLLYTANRRTRFFFWGSALFRVGPQKSCLAWI